MNGLHGTYFLEALTRHKIEVPTASATYDGTILWETISTVRTTVVTRGIASIEAAQRLAGQYLADDDRFEKFLIWQDRHDHVNRKVWIETVDREG